MYLFFPVVMKISRHNKKTANFPPTDDCIFFSGRNQNFPPLQKNANFPPEPKTNTTAQPARQTTVTFFFPVIIARTKNWHNSTTRQTDDWNFFFSGRNCQNRAPNKQTVDQKPCSRKNQTLTQHKKTTGKKVPPAHAKQVYSFLRPSVSPSVCEG